MESMLHKVLLVDDARSHLNLFLHALQDAFTVECAMDGESALAMVPIFQPDAVLLDVFMPGMNGYEVCRRLKENSATREIPVLLTRMKNEVKDESLGFELGAADFVTKPTSGPLLRARLGKCIDNARMKRELRLMRDELKTLTGLFPLCGHCGKVREDQGFLKRLKEYASSQTRQDLTLNVCPDCLKELYPALGDLDI